MTPAGEAPFSPTEKAFLVAAWALIAVLFVWHGLWFPLASPAADYDKHWFAAVAMLEGRSPYIGPDLYLAFNYPLLAGFLFLHLAAFTRATGETVWEITNFLFAIGGTAALAWGLMPLAIGATDASDAPPLVRQARRFLRRHWITVTFLLVANYQPLHRVLVASNIEPLNMLLGSLFVALVVRRKDTAAGIVLTLFALTKLAPVFILIPLVAMRRWRVVAASLGAFAVYGLLLLVTGLWRVEMFLYTDVIPRIPFTYQDLSCSIHRFVASVLEPAILQDEPAYKQLVFWLNAAMMLAYLGMVGAWMRLRDRDPLLLLAWGCFMVLLFTPLLEVNHFVWSAGAMFLQLHAWREGRLRDVPFVLCVFGWTLVMNLKWLLTLARHIDRDMPMFYVQTVALLFVLAVSGIAAFSRLPAGAREEPT